MVWSARRLAAFALFLLAVAPSPAATRPRYQYLHLDHFDVPPSSRLYSSYHGETVQSWQGYGIYFERAEAQLRHIQLAGRKRALQISFLLPAHLDWGDWLSVRRELPALVDLHDYEGLALEVRTESAFNARFRMTLTDVRTAEEAGRHGADELWWYDAPVSLLTPATRPQTLHAPFRDFYLGHGAGMRVNDKQLDLSKIAAFEINLVSSGYRRGAGVVTVDCLRAYRHRRPPRRAGAHGKP